MSLACPQCDQRCKSLSGLKRHQTSVHSSHPGLSVPTTELQRVYHSTLNGMCTLLLLYPTLKISLSTGQCCDRHGNTIQPGTPREPLAIKADDDWSPFTSRVGFELAEFMFTTAELSLSKINKLLELWAATLIPHNNSPPITNHKNLHRQIDAIKLSDVRWENTCLRYERPLPETTHPAEWKTTEYDVWHRNPHEVIKNILARPDLEGHVDYVAYQEFSNEQRQYGNFMSGNWAWKQSVCLVYSVFLFSLICL